MPKVSRQKPNVKLRSARLRKSLTIDGLAKEVGVSSLTVWRWERQGQVPRLEMLRRLKELFDMTEEDLGFGHLFDELTDNDVASEDSK